MFASTVKVSFFTFLLIFTQIACACAMADNSMTASHLHSAEIDRGLHPVASEVSQHTGDCVDCSAFKHLAATDREATVSVFLSTRVLPDFEATGIGTISLSPLPHLLQIGFLLPQTIISTDSPVSRKDQQLE